MQPELVIEAWDHAWHEWHERRDPDMLAELSIRFGLGLFGFSAGADPDATDIFDDYFDDSFG